MGSDIVSSFFSACIKGGGVCTFVVGFSVSKVFKGLYDRCVIEFNYRDEYFGRVGFSGKGINRHGPVEWGVQRLSLLPSYVMCGEFKVAGASVLKIMEGRGGVVSCCLFEVVLSSEGFLLSGFRERDARPCVARMPSGPFERCYKSAQYDEWKRKY